MWLHKICLGVFLQVRFGSFAFYQIIFICLTSVSLIVLTVTEYQEHFRGIQYIQRDTQQDGLLLSSSHVWPPCRVCHLVAQVCVTVCVCQEGGGVERKRLTSSVARSDFIPFSLLLVHEHSKNTRGLLSPVCLHTGFCIFMHLGVMQTP